MSQAIIFGRGAEWNAAALRRDGLDLLLHNGRPQRLGPGGA